jgi:hypothetical protein
VRQHRQELVLALGLFARRAGVIRQGRVGLAQGAVQAVEFAAALDHLGLHLAVVGRQALALLPYLHILGDVVDPVHDVEQLAVVAQHRGVDRTPVTQLEAGAVLARNVVALDRHHVGATGLTDALERAREVACRIGFRRIGIVGEDLEHRPAHDRFAAFQRAAQVLVADAGDGEAGVR